MTRTIRMPGPPATQRITAVPVGAIPIDTVLPAGLRLLDALAALLAGPVESACLTLSGGAFGPFAYVIPSLPPGPSHAAFYSDTRRPPGLTTLDVGAVTVGVREGRPFFHCHALWSEADGRRGCGHVLPDDTMIAAPIHARGAGIAGARFEVRPDPETGFSLFAPHATGAPAPPGAVPALALRLAPNQQLAAALEDAARAAGFRRALVQGGVASSIEARFTDAPPIQGYATELLVRRGVVRTDPADGETDLHIAIVDLHGTIGEGRLAPRDNPVLMTFEGVLQQADGAP